MDHGLQDVWFPSVVTQFLTAVHKWTNYYFIYSFLVEMEIQLDGCKGNTVKFPNFWRNLSVISYNEVILPSVKMRKPGTE